MPTSRSRCPQAPGRGPSARSAAPGSLQYSTAGLTARSDAGRIHLPLTVNSATCQTCNRAFALRCSSPVTYSRGRRTWEVHQEAKFLVPLRAAAVPDHARALGDSVAHAQPAAGEPPRVRLQPGCTSKRPGLQRFEGAAAASGAEPDTGIDIAGHLSAFHDCTAVLTGPASDEQQRRTRGAWCSICDRYCNMICRMQMAAGRTRRRCRAWTAASASPGWGC